VQPAHAPQTGGGRDAHALGQRQVALRGVVLQQVEQSQVDRVQIILNFI